MAVSLFIGLLGGAILGLATQSGGSRWCDLARARHPLLFKSIGLSLLGLALLIPLLRLTGALEMRMTPFFWGGCMTLSFIYAFFAARCQWAEGDRQA